MSLKIEKKITTTDTIKLILTGDLDAMSSSQLEELINSQVDFTIKNLIFDLQSLNFVSSAGLRIFAKSRKIMKSRQGKVYFTNLTPQVKKVFEIVKAVPLSEVFQNVEELDDYLKKMQSKP